jgi:nucleoside-diphosphate-sugar epimerase
VICRPNSKNIIRICNLPKVKIIKCELNDLDLCIFDEKPIDTIYHLAWDNPSGILRADLNTQIKNIEYISEIIKIAKRYNCCKIIATGTIFENLYDSVSKIKKFTNNAYYIYTKKYIYDMLHQLSLQLGLQFVWLTFCHPIGKYIKTDQLIAGTIIKLFNNQPVKLGAGDNIFDIFAVEDLVDALYLTGITKLKKDNYFIGSGHPRSIKEYMECIRDIINPNCELQFGIIETDGLYLSKEWMNCQNFNKETGFLPKISFNTAVDATYNWLINTNL